MYASTSLEQSYYVQLGHMRKLRLWKESYPVISVQRVLC
jgi:hypothetical protein